MLSRWKSELSKRKSWPLRWKRGNSKKERPICTYCEIVGHIADKCCMDIHLVTNQRENHHLIKSLLMEILGILCLSIVALGISILKLFLQIWLMWLITLLNSVTHSHSLVVHNLLSMDHRCHNLNFVLLNAQFHSHNVNKLLSVMASQS